MFPREWRDKLQAVELGPRVPMPVFEAMVAAYPATYLGVQLKHE